MSPPRRGRDRDPYSPRKEDRRDRDYDRRDRDRSRSPSDREMKDVRDREDDRDRDRENGTNGEESRPKGKNDRLDSLIPGFVQLDY